MTEPKLCENQKIEGIKMEFNSCSKLLNDEKIKIAREKYNELLRNNRDPFNVMVNMQKDLQKALFVKNPKIGDIENLKTLGERETWLRDNKIAFDDEFKETVDALAGMNKSPKERSAIWKKWKKNYDLIRSENFENLSENEKVELKFEVCDMFHFFMNMMLATDISADEMFIYYYYKNKENLDRIDRGY